MFQMYITDWARNVNVVNDTFQLVSNETLVLTIPTDDPFKIWLANPSVKAEVNKAESFDFVINPGSEYYNAFREDKTRIRIVYDGTTIFYGPVVSISTSGLMHVKSVHAEGIYSRLADSPVEGVEEERQSAINALEYLTRLINNHNSYVEAWKHVNLGRVTVTPRSDLKKMAATSWSDTLSEMDKLIDQNGGYMRARYDDASKKVYIDWMKDYYRDLGNDRPTIKIAKNLIDISKSSEKNEVFTRVIPVGSKSSTNDKNESRFVYLTGSRYLCIKDLIGTHFQASDVETEFRKASDFTKAEDNYGIIYKTVSFQNANTPEQLLTYCLDWIKRNYYGIITSFSVKAVDMHMLGEADQKILVGDCVNITYYEYDNDGTAHEVTRKLICKAVQYNLFDPTVNVYTFGVPCDSVDFEYGEKAKKNNNKASSTLGATSRSGGGGDTKPKVITWRTVLHFLLAYYYSNGKSEVDPETHYARTVARGKYAYSFRSTVPYKTFKSNGDIQIISQRPISVYEDGTVEYEYQYRDANFYIPEEKASFTGRIMGHYLLGESHDRKVASNYHYGVVVYESRAFTFNWDEYVRVQRVYGNEDIGRHTFNVIFEFDGFEDVEMSDMDLSTETTHVLNEGSSIWTDENGRTVAEISAENNNASFGYIDDNGGWYIRLNHSMSYTDENGNLIELGPGLISCYDINIPEIPSFKTKIAVMDDLIAARATIGELRAYMAVLGDDYDVGEDSFEKDENGNIIVDENGKWKLKSGSRFFVNGHNAAAAAGLYYVNEDTNEIIIKDGGGFKVEKDGVEYGMYHEGNLTGGMIVDKINSQSGPSHTRNRIIGDYVVIGDDSLSDVITKQEQAILDADKKIVNINGDLIQMNTKVTEAESQLISQGKKMLKMEEDVVTLNADLDDVEIDLASHDRSIVKINTDVLNINSTLNDHETKIIEDGKKISKITNDVFLVNSSLNDIEAKLVSQDKTMTKLGSDITVIGGDLTEAEEKLAEQYETLTVIQSDLTKVKNLQANFISTDGADIHIANVRTIRAESIILHPQDGNATNYYAVYTNGHLLTSGDYKIVRNNATYTFNVLDVQPSGNDLIITYSDGTKKTFSKAASLVNGGWSGSVSRGKTLTINAVQRGSGSTDRVVARFTVGFSGDPNVLLGLETNVTDSTPPMEVSGLPKYVRYPVAVSNIDLGSGDDDVYTHVYETYISVNAEIAYNHGFDAVKAPTLSVPTAIDSTRIAPNPSLMIQVDDKTTGGLRYKNLSLNLQKGTYTSGTKTGQRCVNLRVYDTDNSKWITFGRIEIQTAYDDGINAATVTMDNFVYDELTNNELRQYRVITSKAYNSSNSSNYAIKTLRLYVTNGNSSDIAYIRVGSTSGTAIASINHGAYTNGIKAATVTMDDFVYDELTNNELRQYRVITSKAYNTSNTPHSATKTLRLYVTNDSNSDTAYIRVGSTSGTAIASINHGAYTNGLSNATVTVDDFTYNTVSGTPGRTRTITSKAYNTNNASKSATKSVTLYLTQSTDSNTSQIRVGDYSGTVIASYTHNAYSSGASSVTIGDYVWSSGSNGQQIVQADTWEPTMRSATVTLSNGSSKSLGLYLDASSSWDSNHCKRAYVMTGGWNGDKRLMMKIDASSVYRQGVEDGTDTSLPAINITEIESNVTAHINGVVTHGGKSNSFVIALRPSTYKTSNTAPSKYCIDASYGGHIVGRYDIDYVYDYGWNDACGQAFTIVAPSGKTLSYDEEIVVKVYATDSSGTQNLIGSRTYTAPSRGSGGTSYSHHASFIARVESDGYEDTVELGITYPAGSSPFQNGKFYTMHWN